MRALFLLAVWSSQASAAMILELNVTGWRLDAGVAAAGIPMSVGVDSEYFGASYTTADIGRVVTPAAEQLTAIQELWNAGNAVRVDAHSGDASIEGFLDQVCQVATVCVPNVQDYSLEGITQTIANVEVFEEIRRVNIRGTQTVRFYGEPVPEPESWLLVLSLVGVGYRAHAASHKAI